MTFTVFGGRGFIGSQLVLYLERRGERVFVPSRDCTDAIGRDLGHVIYCIGLTGNFRSRPFDTVEAHVGVLSRLLQRCQFDSWLYLSSTRLYAGLRDNALASEDSPLPLLPGSDSLYDLSKLCGEALCLAQAAASVRVARLSNVYGPGQSEHTFLGAILGEARRSGRVTIHESPDSRKDYVALVQILPILESIALHGRERIYNVASGSFLTHAELAQVLVAVTGAQVGFEEGAPRRTFPRIDIRRIVGEFGYLPASLQDNPGALLATSGRSVQDCN